MDGARLCLRKTPDSEEYLDSNSFDNGGGRGLMSWGEECNGDSDLGWELRECQHVDSTYLFRDCNTDAQKANVAACEKRIAAAGCQKTCPPGGKKQAAHVFNEATFRPVSAGVLTITSAMCEMLMFEPINSGSMALYGGSSTDMYRALPKSIQAAFF